MVLSMVSSIISSFVNYQQFHQSSMVSSGLSFDKIFHQFFPFDHYEFINKENWYILIVIYYHFYILNEHSNKEIRGKEFKFYCK